MQSPRSNKSSRRNFLQERMKHEIILPDNEEKKVNLYGLGIGELRTICRVENIEITVKDEEGNVKIATTKDFRLPNKRKIISQMVRKNPNYTLEYPNGWIKKTSRNNPKYYYFYNKNTHEKSGKYTH